MNQETSDKPIILIVDDLEENTKLLERFLKPKGFDVHCAFSGTEALEFVSRSPPDTILLDLIMPGIDGFEVCTRLKQSSKTQHIPIIIITGVAEREANISAIRAGADDFILKPFDAVLLEARIRTSLKAKKLQDEIIKYQQQLEKQNENLEECVKDRTAQLDRMQHAAVFSLAKLAESRDSETGWHLERMRLYAKELSMKLHTMSEYKSVVDDEFIESLYHSSPLHDIGKVGIPDRILLKPGKLTSLEFDIMKEHSVIGGDTLRAADEEAGGNSYLTMGREVAYYHHERWNGLGYPEGLSGTDIPLSARIVAFGDVYDALTSKRPYKEPFSHEKSMGIIVEGRGTQFEPDLVDACESCADRFKSICQEYNESDSSTPIMNKIETLEAQLEECE